MPDLTPDATTTPAAPAAPAAPAPAAGSSATPAQTAGGAQPTQTPWSLDTWKDDDWDALPERIRTVAEGRYKSEYEPKLTEAQQALAQHQADLAAARKEVQDARAAHLRGDPYQLSKIQAAEAELAKLKSEHEAYRKEWSQESFTQRWDAERKAANDRMNQEFMAATQREIHLFAPWYDKQVNGQPNALHDPARAKIAEDLDAKFAEIGGPLAKLPLAFFLKAAELNPAQRTTLVRDIMGDVDPMVALANASKPPKHQPSQAARATAGAPGAADSPPRPDEGMRRTGGSSGAWHKAALAVTPHTSTNAR